MRTHRPQALPLIIMDAFEQAATMLEAIKAELEFNPRLAMDFPRAPARAASGRSAPSLRRTMPRSRSSAPASGCVVFDTARIVLTW